LRFSVRDRPFPRQPGNNPGKKRPALRHWHRFSCASGWKKAVGCWLKMKPQRNDSKGWKASKAADRPNAKRTKPQAPDSQRLTAKQKNHSHL
jgi:hypothetical protein